MPVLLLFFVLSSVAILFFADPAAEPPPPKVSLLLLCSLAVQAAVVLLASAAFAAAFLRAPAPQPAVCSHTLRALIKAALRGHPQAQYGLGSAYYAGRGLPKNDAQAVYWWCKAADQGLPAAQYDLGLACALGIGQPRNHAEALIRCRKAADCGYQPAIDAGDPAPLPDPPPAPTPQALPLLDPDPGNDPGLSASCRDSGFMRPTQVFNPGVISAIMHMKFRREMFPFSPEQVALVHLRKRGAGEGLWFRLYDGRVFDVSGQPADADHSCYE